jgi:hypothetical protein
MGFYPEDVLPRLAGRACGIAGLRRWRAEVTTGLSGRALEIGFGSGLNIGYYPPDFERVFAVEPSATAFRMAGKLKGPRTRSAADPGNSARRTAGVESHRMAYRAQALLGAGEGSSRL